MRKNRIVTVFVVVVLVAAVAAGVAWADPGPYIIRPGDTLGDIAWRYSTTVGAVARANNIPNPDLIYAGQKLEIPGTSEARVAPEGTGVYVVRPGDTLWGIGWTFGVFGSDLARANEWLHPALAADPNLIRPGWLLVLPDGYVPPVGWGYERVVGPLPVRVDGKEHVGPPPVIPDAVLWTP